MDPTRFDALTRVLMTTGARRFVLRGLASAVLGAPLALLGLTGSERVEAKNKKKKKKTCRNCGSCQRCNKGKCKAKTDGAACVGGRICLGGECACSPGNEEIAGRCAAPCGDACEETCDVCADTFDGGAEFCGRLFIGNCSELLPCANHGGCATNELCVVTGCPAVNGVTNKCRALC